VFGISLSVAELIRSLLLSLLFYGNGGTIGLHWTGEMIGNTLSVTPYIEYAYFGGGYMLTCITGIFVYCVVLITKNTKIYTYYIPFAVVTFLLVLIHYTIPTHTPQKPVKLAVISTTFTFPEKNQDVSMTLAQHFIKIYMKTVSLASYNPDIIVYPEDAQFTRLLIDGRDKEIKKMFPDTLIVDGSTIEKNGSFSNVSVFYNTRTSEKSYTYKQFMFPLNEYIPYIFMSIFHYFINPDILQTFTKDHGYAPIIAARSYVHNGIRVATLLCSEIVSFKTVKNMGAEHPDIIFHQAQLILFRGSLLYTAHLRSFTKVAAAQLRTTTVGSINELPSYIVSPYGKIIDEVYSTNKNEVQAGIYVISKDGIRIISNPVN
jgi:apolipoprotein N-acyltransferase